MPRKLRIEYAGAKYHVINRGNYRADIFRDSGARAAFMTCLEETCVKTGWVVHGFVLMRNHYHLAIETPVGNLVEGMQWLQSTFANRFNRLRRENGHVFQGRYKALPVEDGDAMSAVVHYVHLNPVRAKLLPVERLAEYRDSSYALLWTPKKRPGWLSLETCLRAAGGLSDTPSGWKQYERYLAWVMESDAAQKELRFAQMTRAWALGSDEFRKDLAKTYGEKLAASGRSEAATRELRELAWEEAVTKAMRRLRKTSADTEKDLKSAAWKVAIAAHLRKVSTASNVWLAQRLGMGDPDGVSRYVGQLRQGERREAEEQLVRITGIRV